MKIYFFSTSNNKKAGDAGIAASLKASGAEVFGNLEITSASLPEAEARQAEESGQTLLDKIDALVIEGSANNHQTGYLVAYAVSNRKPVLYLVERGQEIDDSLRQLQKNKNSARFFSLQYYLPSQLERLLQDFIKRAEIISGVEAPMIKFTLRITPSIDRYLHWKTHNTPMTKADFMRKAFIDEIIKKDRDYNNSSRLV